MAERTIERRPPHIGASTVLRMSPPATRHVLRGAPGGLPAAGEALGLSLSMPACRASVHGSRAALWLGPDERLLLGEDASAAETERQLGQALGDQPYSLVDVSHRQLALAIAGPHAS